MKTDRQQGIVAFLKQNKVATVKELAAYLDVSDMTIRRKVADMKQLGLVSMMNGVVILQEDKESLPVKAAYDLTDDDLIRSEQKRSIGEFAASLIAENDVIVLDTGSTTLQLAKYLPDEMPMTVVCYNMNNLMEVYKRKACDIIMPGGQFYRNTQMFHAPEGPKMVERIRANKAFISATGIDKTLGLTCLDQYEVAIKQAVIRSSLSRILLADSSKFDHIAPAYFAHLSEFDIIVTDSGLGEQWQKDIRNMGIKLYVV